VNDADKEKEVAENAYLLAELPVLPPHDTATRIKGFFERLVAEGNAPTSAAVKAIEMVTEEQKMGRKHDGGALSGKASKMGVCTSRSTLQDAVALAIEWNSAEAVIDVLRVAAKYLGNAIKEPWSSKFRSFKLSNHIADKITRLEGCLAVLQGLGFEISGTCQEFRATLPVSVDLDDMNQVISRLIEDLKSRG
jgi:hypothetical protein